VSNLLRNLLILLAAWRRRGNSAPQDTLVTRFVVTPLDVGIRTLKTDKYLQLAECAQLDFVMRTGLMRRLLRGHISFVNVLVQVRFAKPVQLGDRLELHTRVAGADARCAWFEHEYRVRGEPCARVLVRMKFKQGRLTVPPADLLGEMPPPPAVEAAAAS
jgi:acyl-CoA thioesterase FadM